MKETLTPESEVVPPPLPVRQEKEEDVPENWSFLTAAKPELSECPETEEEEVAEEVPEEEDPEDLSPEESYDALIEMGWSPEQIQYMLQIQTKQLTQAELFRRKELEYSYTEQRTADDDLRESEERFMRVFGFYPEAD
jgi:hypothetical protein